MIYPFQQPAHPIFMGLNLYLRDEYIGMQQCCGAADITAIGMHAWIG
jgi:hypothetical protein